MSLIAVSVLLLQVNATAVAERPAPSFCQRMAQTVDMHPAKAPATWELKTINSVKAALVGGRAMVTMGISASGDPSVVERLKTACQPVRHGMACRVESPAVLQFGLNDRRFDLPTLPGDRSTVTTQDTTVRCVDN